MPDILQDFPINAPIEKVFQSISTPMGLDNWWTQESDGQAVEGAEFKLGFGPEYNWRAKVVRCVPNIEFELEMTQADGDWLGTRVGLHLEDREGLTWIQFHHTGWPQANEHYRISTHCWAAYLRILRRFLEHGESVPYEKRLEA